MLTNTEKRVLDHINPDEVVAWTQELVRIPSVYRPRKGEAEEPAARWVETRFKEMGLQTTWEEVEPGRPNVIGIHKGDDNGKTLMFEGHTDVVTEGDASQWTHDPFGAEIVEGRIYGRGANDMKGGLVAAICATKAIVESGVQLKGNILIGALADEEGLMKGVKHFVRQGWAENVDAALICEPEDNRLCVAQKGVMWVRITATGKMAHGCMPLTGVNPIYPMGAFLTELQKMEAGEIARHGSDPFLGQPSITPTIIESPLQGEPQNNVMPARCRVTLDVRLIPGQSPEDIEAGVRGIFEQLEGGDTPPHFDLEVIESRPPTS
ncbi:MAG: M20 family metallopeptidase, partial [Chloroflexota bacterium]|nr:M20 family metallopeptidase [Chloroflexota bacterium]